MVEIPNRKGSECWKENSYEKQGRFHCLGGLTGGGHEEGVSAIIAGDGEE